MPKVAGIMDVTYPAAQNAVRRLVELGILQEVDGTSQPKRYICRPVIETSEQDASR